MDEASLASVLRYNVNTLFAKVSQLHQKSSKVAVVLS